MRGFGGLYTVSVMVRLGPRRVMGNGGIIRQRHLAHIHRRDHDHRDVALRCLQERDHPLVHTKQLGDRLDPPGVDRPRVTRDMAAPAHRAIDGGMHPMIILWGINNTWRKLPCSKCVATWGLSSSSSSVYVDPLPCSRVRWSIGPLCGNQGIDGMHSPLSYR